jgi:hypothetical protein
LQLFKRICVTSGHGSLNFIMSVHLSFCLHQFGFHRTYFHEIRHWRILRKSVKEIQSDQKVFVYLMIAIQKVIYSKVNLTTCQPTARVRRTLDSHYSHLLSLTLYYHDKLLKPFKIFLRVVCSVIVMFTETFWLPCVNFVQVGRKYQK